MVVQQNYWTTVLRYWRPVFPRALLCFRWFQATGAQGRGRGDEPGRGARLRSRVATRHRTTEDRSLQLQDQDKAEEGLV